MIVITIIILLQSLFSGQELENNGLFMRKTPNILEFMSSLMMKIVNESDHNFLDTIYLEILFFPTTP